MLCELDVDECETEYICGEGKCENIPGSYRCICPLKKCGLYCALDDPCILVDPCINGKCISNCKAEPNYTCECYDGFFGKLCNQTMVNNLII